MALSQADVDEFLAMAKEVKAGTELVWKKRNAGTVMSRVPVVAGGVERGELLALYHLDSARHWTFKLQRLGVEVLRWDAQPPPHSHSNPPGRPDGWLRKFFNEDHEHIWHPIYAMKLARPSPELAAAQDHRAAFAAFGARANIDTDDCYRPPPPPAEQLHLLP